MEKIVNTQVNVEKIVNWFKDKIGKEVSIIIDHKYKNDIIESWVLRTYGGYRNIEGQGIIQEIEEKEYEFIIKVGDYCKFELRKSFKNIIIIEENTDNLVFKKSFIIERGCDGDDNLSSNVDANKEVILTINYTISLL
jgi:hypothetical protein